MNRNELPDFIKDWIDTEIGYGCMSLADLLQADMLKPVYNWLYGDDAMTHQDLAALYFMSKRDKNYFGQLVDDNYEAVGLVTEGRLKFLERKEAVEFLIWFVEHGPFNLGDELLSGMSFLKKLAERKHDRYTEPTVGAAYVIYDVLFSKEKKGET